MAPRLRVGEQAVVVVVGLVQRGGVQELDDGALGRWPDPMGVMLCIGPDVLAAH